MGFFKVSLSGTDKKTKIKLTFLQPFNITNMEIFVTIFYKIKEIGATFILHAHFIIKQYVNSYTEITAVYLSESINNLDSFNMGQLMSWCKCTD